MHPILITALAEGRRHGCPCWLVAQQRYGLCRERQVAAVWRHETTARTGHRVIQGWTRASIAQVRFATRVALLIRLSSRKVES